MSELCISCDKEVNGRRHAVTCDVCDRWQHRLCGTGITQAQYFAARRGEEPLRFVCQPCVMNIPPRESEAIEVADEATEAFLEEVADAEESVAISLNATFTLEVPSLSLETDSKALLEYVELFIDSYKDLIDFDFNHLKDGFSEEGPHLTKLPDGILQVLGNQLHECCFTDDLGTVKWASYLLKCLIVLCRNYDNVPLVASCEFVSYTVKIASSVIEKIRDDVPEEEFETYIVFCKLTFHFFECLYDPYFIWRKRLLGWNVDETRFRFKPALLHVEVIPFFHDCFQRKGFPLDMKLRLIHVFGAFMSGSQTNALKAITPATLDVLLKILSSNEQDRPTNEQRQEMLALKDLVLKCTVRMVHVIHCCSPDQRQVEVSQIMEGYMQVLLEKDTEPENEIEMKMQLTMIGAINEMLLCQDKSALQVILVSGGTFDSFISLLQNTSLCGPEAQQLAMSVLNVMSTVLAGSFNAKERFKLRVGYGRFVEVLKRLGQPSMELLKSVLNLVVEAIYEEKKPYTVHNTQAAIMLIQWLPDIHSHDLQIWLSENLRALCSFQHKNKMNCCNDGMIGSVLTVLGREKQINPVAVSHLIGLLESLGTLSITAIELKQLIGLLKLDEEENQLESCLHYWRSLNKYCSRLMRAMSTMARREGKDGALHFFDFRERADGITLPGIRKWPGQSFTFHTWFCLDQHLDMSHHDLQPDQPYRRQIYSFLSSSGSGFEAFVSHHGDIVVAVHSKKEYYTAVVEDADILDSNWHSLDIMHTNSKRPFVNSHLYVYVDSKLKLDSQLKFPNLSEPLTSCRVGGPQPHSHLEMLIYGTAPVVQETKKPSPLRSLFKHATKNHTNQTDIESIPYGTQDEVWGPALSLHGQIGCVCLLHDLLNLGQVEALYRTGPNNLTLLDIPDAADLMGKLILRYNAKACKDNHCVDLSSNQNHGQLIGQKCVTWDIKDVVNCIGGIQVLFPLLEQVNKIPVPKEVLSPDMPVIENLNQSTEQDDWLILPSSSYADTKLEQNQVAGFLTLLRNMVQTQPTNQDSFVRTNGAAIIGALLQKVNKKLVDVHVLMAVQLLVEATAPTNKTMLNHLYQYVLFDFRIWSRSDFPVRIGHIQYLSTIIKDDRRHFRKTFGVQFILDVIKFHYSSDCGLSEEDAKTIRVSLLNLIKFYIVKEITKDELNCLLHFMIACREENMICEVLDLLVLLLENYNKQDQLYLLMFEPEAGELLYGLLTIKGYTIIFYEKVVKVLYLLLKTEKVYEKSKVWLQLQDCGYLGLVGLMQGCEVSGPTIKRFMEQVSVTDTPNSYNAVLAILQLIYTSGFDIKLEASRQLQSILVSKTGAAKSFAKQLGWQEAITKLFILHPLSNSCDRNLERDDSITMSDNNASKGSLTNFFEGDYYEGDNSEGLDLSKGSNQNALSCENSKDCDLLNSRKDLLQNEGESKNESCDSLSEPLLPDQSVVSDIKRAFKSDVKFSLDLKRESDSQDSLSSPQTPLYLKRQMDDVLSEEEISQPVSRSSSASAEDLSAIGQRQAEQTHIQKESESTSTLNRSESDFNFENEGVVMRRESLSSSQINYSHSMMDSLGLRGSFLMESVEDSEELCQNLLIVLLTIMWKGVEGSDKAAWQERGQVFSWLDHISETNELIRPVKELKRCLLEMLLHSCLSEIKDAGHSSQTYMENAIELVRIIRHFVTEKPAEMDIFSETLLDDVMCLLDCLAVWDVQSGGGWQEMVHLGLSILLSFANHETLDLCASSAAQLHRLIQTKLISSSAEASFLIGHLNDVIVKAVKEKTDNYSYTIPVLKALIEKAEPLLTLDLNLPNLPSTSLSPTFFDDFKTYCVDEEWTSFIDNYVNPQKVHFMENVFTQSSKNTHKFWEECHEQMKVNIHKRNRERGESKLKFQSQILEVYNKKLSHEERRFQNISAHIRNQHYSALRQWRATKRFFTGERGAWAERNTAILHWKLSNQENFSRMKVKLIQNYNFDTHREASLLRDNLGVDNIDVQQQLECLSIAKEALVAKENLGDDALGDEEWNVISSSSTTNAEYQDKEKLVIAEECELVTLVEVIKGRLEVTTTHVYFFDCSGMKEEGGEDFKWSLSQLREIHFRRYNLRRSALEMFLVDQTNYFLNFEKKVRNKVYSRILNLRPPNLIYYGSRSPAELLKASNLVQKWVQHEISNFEYLMQLNTIAGRTYNDLSQYPVFPWILSDYTSKTLELDNPEVFRDLSKPIGALNPKNEEEVRDKYENFEDPSGVIGKFHYGTHYSNSAGVMHYLIRMEPFTTLHIALQGGRFDVADRQFHSIPGTWSSMYSNPSDVKELIPEFFYLPEFLINTNEFDLGKLQISKEQVTDVVLPNWASSPEDFICKHRKALESEYVSNNLHNWIDLIFGYKQKGAAAVEALNVFYYCTYEGAVDLDAIKNDSERKALEGMINNFGQTPCQLLKDPHPRRMTFDEVVARALRTEKRLSVFYFLEQLKVYFVEVSHDTDPLAYICVPRNQTRSIIQHGMPDTMVTVSTNGILGTHGWLPYDKSISNYFTFERDPSVSNPKTRKKYSCPFAPGLKVEPKLFVVSHDAKLLFSGGHWDNSLQVISVSKAKKINHIVRHIDIVTCLSLDYCGSHLITGSRDTTCIIWQVIQQGGVSVELSPKPLQILYGHDNEVTAVHISIELDMAVSASKDGSVIIHTVRKGHYMRTLRPPHNLDYVMNIPMLAVDDMGHVIVYCHETFPIDPKEIISLHVYSLNGKKICSTKLQHQLGHMIVKGDYLVTGDSHGSISVLEIFGLRILTTLPLHVPIHCLALTNGNSHLFAGLRDGKLILIGIKNRSDIR